MHHGAKGKGEESASLFAANIRVRGALRYAPWQAACGPKAHTTAGSGQPHPTALPLGIGNREWGMVGRGNGENGEADSPFRLPIPKGRAVGWG